MLVDENGWARGPVEPLDPSSSWALLAPEADSRVDLPRWAHNARTFFRAALEIAQPKKYPTGTAPDCDAFELELTPRGAAPTRVLVVTLPLRLAPDVVRAADAGVRAIGGAGFDALVARAQRVWQVADTVGNGDPRAPLAVAAILASALLAPIVPPNEVAIFGVKGARERLAKRGWA